MTDDMNRAGILARFNCLAPPVHAKPVVQALRHHRRPPDNRTDLTMLQIFYSAYWARVPKPALAFSMIVVTLMLVWPTNKLMPLNAFDQPFYIGITHDMLDYGRFTNGFMFESKPHEDPPPPGMRFTPVYPAILYVVARFDPVFRSAINCVVRTRAKSDSCPESNILVRRIQFVMLCVIYWLIWWMTRRVSGQDRVAWLALGIGLLTASDMLGHVDYVMTEITSIFFVTLTFTALIEATVRQRHGLLWFGAAGIFAGLAGLTRPEYPYVAVFSCVLFGFFALFSKQKLRNAASILVFMGALTFTITPWIARNRIVLGRTAFTSSYGAHVLNERIAFDEMTWFEYRLSYLCWLPDGNGMGSLLFGPHTCDRFQWSSDPNSFYSIGNGQLMQQSLKASGGWPHMMPYLIKTYIIPHAFKHFLVTIPLALRGAYVNRYWGLILLPICLLMTWRALRRRDAQILILTMPAWINLLFVSAVSVDQPRYNLMLIIPYSISGAIMLEHFLRTRVMVRRIETDTAL